MPNTIQTEPTSLASLMAALEPRVCACGSETGSPALERCESCEVAP